MRDRELNTKLEACRTVVRLLKTPCEPTIGRILADTMFDGFIGALFDCAQTTSLTNNDLARDIRVVAYTCIINCARGHFENFQSHLSSFFELAFKTIKGDDDQVVQRAIEVWYEVIQAGTADEKWAHNLDSEPLSGQLKALVPLLLEALVAKQSESELLDNPSKLVHEASACLSAMSCIRQGTHMHSPGHMHARAHAGMHARKHARTHARKHARRCVRHSCCGIICLSACSEP